MMLFNKTNGLAALLAVLACVPRSMGRDSNLDGITQIKLRADATNGKGITFKTVDSDDHVTSFDYATDVVDENEVAGVVKTQDYPFGVFFKASADQRVHTIVSA
jgi:hypothetical protein